MLISTEEQVPKHPVRRAISVLRGWLLLVFIVMLWNALFANGYLLPEALRPAPFLFAAAMTLVWFRYTWHVRVVIAMSGMLTVGTLMRAIEVMCFAHQFRMNERLTALSIWLVTAGTLAAFGVLNILAISRKAAESWVWDIDSSR